MTISDSSSNLFTGLGLILLLAVLPSPASSQHRIALTMEKDQYLVDESIWFEAIEENLTDEMVISSLFHPGSMAYCKLILTDSHGDTLPYRGGMHETFYQPERWNGYELHPGDQRYLVMDMLGVFGEQDETHRFSFHLPPGRYAIQVLLHTRYGWFAEYPKLTRQIGRAAALEQVDRRTIRSNIVEFEIVEPVGIEKKAHEKLLEAGRLEWGITQGSDAYVQLYQIRKELVAEFPNSVYTLVAYARFKGYLASKAGHKVDLEKQVALFHDRIYMHSLLSRYPEEQLQELLPDVRRKYPGSKAQKYLEKHIEVKKGRVQK